MSQLEATAGLGVGTPWSSRPASRFSRVALAALLVALASALTLGPAMPSEEAAPAAVPTASSLAPTEKPAPAPVSAERRQQALGGYQKLPLAFAPNAGQTDERVLYTAQGAGYSFFFTERGMTLSLTRDAPSAKQGGDDAAHAGDLVEHPMLDSPFARLAVTLELGFRGASPDARLVGSARAAGTVNYLSGAASDRGRSGLPTYSELTYRDLWPGIDMSFRGEGGKLKYEFHVHPGADPTQIKLAYRGAEGLTLGSRGALRVKTALGALKDARPASYQRAGGRRVPVASRYRLEGGAGYGFALAGYDPSRPLVIDPGLAYSTFLGGADFEDGRAIAVDKKGSAYITGSTNSANYPTTPGAHDRSFNGDDDVFVTKLSPAGSALRYSTFLGGTSLDQGEGITVDRWGNAYVTGRTVSADYPTTPGAHDRSFNGADDVFVTKLNAVGSALRYSTFIGGTSVDQGRAIAVDGWGSAYVTGNTFSADYPTTPGAYDQSFNAVDAVVTKLSPAGSALRYSTFLGGTSLDQGEGITVDRGGNAYVTGRTVSADYPTTRGAHDRSFNGADDVFVTKLSPAGSALRYSTLIGGTSSDAGFGIAADRRGNAYVTGETRSSDYPTTPRAFDRSFNSAPDPFVTKLNSAGSALRYSTFLGGALFDAGFGIAVDQRENAYVTGSTVSADYPTTPDAYDQDYNGVIDAFVTKLNRAGSALLYSTFLGGTEGEEGFGIAVDAHGSAYVTGYTFSADFPTTPGAYDQDWNGEVDAIVTKLAIGERDDDHDDHDD